MNITEGNNYLINKLRQLVWCILFWFHYQYI